MPTTSDAIATTETDVDAEIEAALGRLPDNAGDVCGHEACRRPTPKEYCSTTCEREAAFAQLPLRFHK